MSLKVFITSSKEVVLFFLPSWIDADKPSLVVFGFGVCENVRLQVGRLGEFLIAAVERAHVGPVTGVDPHVRAQVEVQRKPFPAPFEGTLEKEKQYY